MGDLHISAGTGFKTEVYLQSLKRIQTIKKVGHLFCVLFFRVLNVFKASEIAGPDL